MPREIMVHIDLNGKTRFVGRLWIHVRNRRESASFEYASAWKSFQGCFPLEPALYVGDGAYHTEKSLFGAIGDSAPDRWGRNLMNRLEARAAKREGRAARQLQASDYLLMVCDLARQGALRFAVEDSDFLAPPGDIAIPPLVALPRLLEASANLISRREDDRDIRDLLEPGGSLGGARPKAAVTDKGNLLIAKFPSPKDDWDVVAWEYLALKMARQCGIPTPGFKLVKVAGENVLLLGRFDRVGATRIPFLSAMSMLGASDGDRRSYLEIGDILRSYGSQTGEDLKDIWRRIVFNILVSNVDDHLRNHGFLYDGQAGWRLSPVYDLEPTPGHVRSRELSTSITLNDPSASLDLAYGVAENFGIDLPEAKQIAKHISMVTGKWRIEAGKIGISKHEIELMQSAFEHVDLELASKS